MTDYYDGNWHTWEGGWCPVTAGTIVEVELRGGERMKPHEASSFEWRHYDGPADIIRFRVVNSTTEEAEDLPNERRRIVRKPRTVHLEGDVPEDVIGIAKNIVREHDEHKIVGADELQLSEALLSLQAADTEKER